MNDQQVKKLIDTSPTLQGLSARLTEELAAVDSSFSFDPLLIIAIIGIVINVLIHCRDDRTEEDIEFDMRRFRALPPRKLMRIRRRLNQLWINHYQVPTSARTPNTIVRAVYNVAANLNEKEIHAIIKAARQK